MNRNPVLIVILLCMASVAAGAGGTAVFLAYRKKPAVEPTVPVAKAPAAVPAATVPAATNPSRLPADRVLLPAADAAEFRGKAVCGHCEWQVGSVCQKDVLWDAEKHHLVVLLPNEKLTELQKKLTPT